MGPVADITFDFVDDVTSDPVVTIAVFTPAGTIKFMAEPAMAGRTLTLHGLHVQDLQSNAVGAANLMVLADAVMEGMEIDGLVIEGALRTTGANPGRKPRILRFTRRVRSAPRGESPAGHG